MPQLKDSAMFKDQQLTDLKPERKTLERGFAPNNKRVNENKNDYVQKLNVTDIQMV